MPTPAPATADLHFARGGDDPDMLANVSAAVAVSGALFLGSDEGVMLERLHATPEGWGGHSRVDLSALLGLEDGAEADIEGLATDADWLWVVGSHARVRPKAEPDDEGLVDLADLAKLKDTRARCLLARLPLVPGKDGPVPVERDGKRRAGLLKRSVHGNALWKLLAKDPLIGPFTRVGAKEGGLDIEGIAVAGSRVALGLRGPVIRDWAVLLELEVECRKSGRLKIGEGPHVRLVDLEGLGIRDLKLMGDDLLILAGPTTSLSGPCRVHRWANWRHEPPAHEGKVTLHRPPAFLELRVGRGEDHPEGLAIVPGPEGGHALMVLCDSPSAARLDLKAATLKADLYPLQSG